jgi:hypothetical protein
MVQNVFLFQVIYLKEYEGKITQRYCESSGGFGAENTPPIDPQLTNKLLSLMRAYLVRIILLFMKWCKNEGLTLEIINLKQILKGILQ